ncbi:MAG: tRNA pseudouridine(13) synthase TruD [Myxococcota bacterium]
MTSSKRPLWTSDLPGIGGRFKASPDDFEVEEIPLYEPSGEGQHLYLWIEKEGLAGGDMLSKVASHLGIRRRDIGTAGIKDKEAVTRQWISVPAHKLDVDDFDSLVGEWSERLRVLEARKHRNKLRRGHLTGNRFSLTLRDLDISQDEALERGRATAAVLMSDGLPNYYGLQRFGDGGSTLELGLGLLEDSADAKKRVRGNRFLRRLAINAVQSHLFNGVLRKRIEDAVVETALLGDALQKTDTGGTFVAGEQDLEDAQHRLDAGKLVVTGPMPGPDMLETTDEAARLEQSVYDEEGVDISLFANYHRLAPGARRKLQVSVGDVTLEANPFDESAVDVSFELPSGSYATVLLRELSEPVT